MRMGAMSIARIELRTEEYFVIGRIESAMRITVRLCSFSPLCERAHPMLCTCTGHLNLSISELGFFVLKCCVVRWITIMYINGD